MLTFLLQGLTLGFAAGAQPGPFQTYLISQTLSQGWRRAWIAAFAPLVSDGPIVALVLLVLSQVPDWFQRVLQIAGGLFVLYLAWSAYRAWQAFAPDAETPPQTGPRSLLRAALMNALSPGPYLFWSLVVGPLIVTAWRADPSNAVSIVLGFYIALVSLNLTVVALFGQASRFGNRARKAMLGFSVLALAGFGLYQLWQGIFV
ncbi:MAG: LysE family transporter [Anaerolineales bacterium]|nr:LysE family transporter [Anaerolineales bacterium]